jgi:hypothetical protein
MPENSNRKNENWEAKLSFQAEEFLKEREQRDAEVKSWEKEKKRWKAFKTELETEVRVSHELLKTLRVMLCFT